jgi:hypothetical protein
MYAIDFNRDIDIDIEFAELVEPVAVRAPKPRCADGHGTLTHLFLLGHPARHRSRQGNLQQVLACP